MDSDCVVSQGPALGNTLDARTYRMSERPAVDVPAIVREAVEAAGEKHEAVAFDAGYQPSYWTRVLSCERGITLDRLGRLSRAVQKGIVSGWAAALGLRLERRDRQARAQALAALVAAAQALLEEGGAV